MKRHLLVLAPLSVFLFFVGCGGDDETPPATVAAQPAFKEQIQCGLDRAIKHCQSGLNAILPAIIAQNGSGSNNNAALIMAALSQKRPIDKIPPAPGQKECKDGYSGETQQSVSCDDGLTQLLLLTKATSAEDGQKYWEKPEVQRYITARIKNAAAAFGQRTGLNPLQQLALGRDLQSSFGQGGFNPADVAAVNSIFAAQQPNTATVNPAAYTGAGGMTAGTTTNNATVNSALNTNSGNPYQPQSASTGGTSVSLNLGVRSSTAKTSSVVMDAGTKQTPAQTLGINQLRAARGFGLSSDVVKQAK